MKRLMPYMEQLEKDMAFSEYAVDHIVKKAMNDDDFAIKKFCRWDGRGEYCPNASSFLINLIKFLLQVRLSPMQSIGVLRPTLHGSQVSRTQK